MFAKRIIPCLDVKDGRVVKGVNFVDLRDAGDPVEVAAAYSQAGADEVVFLDITASHEGRATAAELAARVAELIREAAQRFGSQCVVVAIDARRRPDGSGWDVYKTGGRQNTGLDALEWAARVEALGAGEILLTSMDADGTKAGYDLELTAAVSGRAGIPVIASGGAGAMEHFLDAFQKGKADAVLAASLFHYHEIGIPDLKAYLAAHGVPIRPVQG